MNRKWQAEEVEDLPISEEAKRYLVEVGIPSGEMFDFTKPGTAPKGCFLLGHNYEVPICLVPDGTVCFFEDGTGFRFANADPIKFSKSVDSFLKYQEDVIDLDEDSALEVVGKAIEDLKQIDSKAFADDENVWPRVAEQMQAGLL